MTTKILIIKLGYSETLAPEIDRVPSLGDVLRTTAILWALKEKYPDSYITWLVDKHAEPILNKNPLIDRILVWDNFVPFQLMREKFDTLINLEKIPGVCALADMIDAWVKYGFRFESTNGTYHGYEKGMNVINYIDGKKNAGISSSIWQKVLIEMLDVPWREQEYIIGYTPKSNTTFDIGLNHQVGSKWPDKAMPANKWKELKKKLLDLGYTVTCQQGLENLYEYMDWINSCKTIITNDSLGLHMAFAFKKKVIGLFGPTDPQEVFFYGKGRIVTPDMECEFMPCYAPICKNSLQCMNSIRVDHIVDAATEQMSKADRTLNLTYRPNG